MDKYKLEKQRVFGHAKKRFKERCRIDYTNALRRLFVKIIRQRLKRDGSISGRPHQVVTEKYEIRVAFKRQDRFHSNRTLWRVDFRELTTDQRRRQWFSVVYDHGIKQVVTVLQ